MSWVGPSTRLVCDKCKSEITVGRAWYRGTVEEPQIVCRTCARYLVHKELVLPAKQRNKSRKRTKKQVCQNCNAPLEGRRSSAKYCSIKCRRAAAYPRRREALGQVALAVKTCPTCQTSFKQRVISHRFCTATCRKVWHKKEQAAARGEEYAPPSSKPEPPPPAKRRKRPMVETDTGRKCRPEELQPGETIVRFFVG